MSLFQAQNKDYELVLFPESKTCMNATIYNKGEVEDSNNNEALVINRSRLKEFPTIFESKLSLLQS